MPPLESPIQRLLRGIAISLWQWSAMVILNIALYVVAYVIEGSHLRPVDLREAHLQLLWAPQFAYVAGLVVALLGIGNPFSSLRAEDPLRAPACLACVTTWALLLCESALLYATLCNPNISSIPSRLVTTSIATETWGHLLTAWRCVGPVLGTVQSVSVAVFLSRAAKVHGAPTSRVVLPVIVALLVGSALVSILIVLLRVEERTTYLAWGVANEALAVPVVVLLLGIARAASRGRKGFDSGAARTAFEWEPAATGLNLFRIGLLTRGIVLGGSFVLFLAFIFVQSSTMLHLSIVAWPAGTFISSLILCVGLAHYCVIPSRLGRRSARFALAFLIGACVLDTWALSLVFCADSLQDLERAGIVALFAFALFGTGLLGLLVSLRRVVVATQPALARRPTRVAIQLLTCLTLVIVTSAGLPDRIQDHITGTDAFALLGLVAFLMALGGYFLLVRETSKAVEQTLRNAVFE